MPDSRITKSITKENTGVKPHAKSNMRFMWLDYVPSDVRERIIAYATAGKRMNQVLHLTKVSPHFQKTITKVFSHHFKMHYKISASDMHSCVHLLDGTLRELTIFDFSRHGEAARRLLNSPSLVRVTIPDFPDLLDMLPPHSSIRELTVKVGYLSTQKSLMAVISRLNLTSLKLLPFYFEKTPQQKLWVFAPDQVGEQVLTAFKKITNVHISSEVVHPTAIWPMIKCFPAVRAVTLTHAVPDSAIPYLRNLESVSLHDFSGSLRLAGRIGKAVKAIWCFSVRQVCELEELSNCDEIKDLHINLPRGGEVVLPTNMLALESLQLCRKMRRRGPGEESATWFAAAQDGFLQRVVGREAKLTMIGLRGIRIRCEELTEMMRRCGSYLKVLIVPMMGQDENRAVRLTKVLEACGTYNPNIRMVLVDGRYCGVETEDANGMTEEQARNLKDAHERLRQRAPWVDTTSIDRAIRKMVRGWLRWSG